MMTCSLECVIFGEFFFSFFFSAFFLFIISK
jgi:hypothetical protein